METAYQIFEYLPLKYKNSSDADYFSFLVHSVDQNYQAENYHFAVVALHMIYMGIVYHYIYGIFRADPKRFEYVLIGFHDRLQVKEIDNISWHSFSNENESTSFKIASKQFTLSSMICDQRNKVQTDKCRMPNKRCREKCRNPYTNSDSQPQIT